MDIMPVMSDMNMCHTTQKTIYNIMLQKPHAPSHLFIASADGYFAYLMK